jgi:protein-tyrosine phosphatase
MPLRDARVERDADGGLVVSWSTDGQDAVDVSFGTSPIASEHTLVIAGTTSTTARIDGSRRERLYISLKPADSDPIVVAERRVPFTGITNLRDLGGYPTAGGGVTRWGLVFRADALHKLTDDDLETFHGLGVRTVYDLRGDVERIEFPGPGDSVHMPIVGRASGADPPARSLEMTHGDGEALLRDIYVGILQYSKSQIGTILRGLAEPDVVPAVFHCHGGKDRTGVVAAVLLLALGVDGETVLDDYQATSVYRQVEHQQDSLANMLATGMSPEAAVAVLGTPRWAMSAALDAIADVYGGIDAYLTSAAGLTLAEVTGLRDLLVEGRDL